MSPTHRHGPRGIDLSREAAWVLHAAVVEHAERTAAADGDVGRVVAVIDRIESGARLDETDREVAREALDAHLENAPERDREPAAAVRTALGAQASSSQ
ncbi:hypothetical protein SAMN04488065_2274 [Haloplanus vescus]|uniref:Uncharacterized protein n=1 Tax=Haloplanus vescus TaxID=555874 RepID=A0A1H3ZBT1_9EURY|nr:hypothetical protein [Haloplanus vescus]SEA21226.1 hypothetical protein SAMN04488065_2274 [Haloplanus vescus]